MFNMTAHHSESVSADVQVAATAQADWSHVERLVCVLAVQLIVSRQARAQAAEEPHYPSLYICTPLETGPTTHYYFIT